jgi:ribosomal-protein-alanine N-acetyltransferase
MIKGDKINLRLVEEKDLARYHRLYNDIGNRGEYYYMGLEPESVITRNYHETGYWDRDFGRMLIVDKNDQILGYLNYFKSVSYFSSYEIGYRLFDVGAHGKGIMTEAVGLFAAYLFRAYDINRLEIRTHPENKGSQKVALKNGFVEEGRARGAVLYKNEYIDMLQYSLTRQEFYAGHK